MQKLKYIQFIIISAIIAFVLFADFSCKKPEKIETIIDEDTATEADNAVAEEAWMTVFTTIEEDVTSAESMSLQTLKTSDDCPTTEVSYSADSSYLDSITLTYPPEGCSGIDGRVRKGVILITQNGKYRKPGTELEILLQDFYVDDIKIEGSKTIIFESSEIFIVEVKNSKIIIPEGEILWESFRKFERIEGINTPLAFCDDEWVISGNASGTNRNKRNYSVQITEDLHKKICCKFISEGIITITPDGITPRTIDFGDGTCDRRATVTNGNRTKTIFLR